MAVIDPEEIVFNVINQKVNALISDDSLRITVNQHQLAMMTGVSESTLLEQFEPQPYVTKLERRAGKPGKRGKKVWLYPEIKDAWRHYLDTKE